MRNVSRTRAEAIAELAEQPEGFEHWGKLALADQSRRALAELADGAVVVTVGHTVYRIREADAA